MDPDAERRAGPFGKAVARRSGGSLQLCMLLRNHCLQPYFHVNAYIDIAARMICMHMAKLCKLH